MNKHSDPSESILSSRFSELNCQRISQLFRGGQVKLLKPYLYSQLIQTEAKTVIEGSD